MKTPSLLFPLIAAVLAPRLAAAEMFVYFGSHGFGPNIGFSLARFDSETGLLTQPRFLLEAREPAFFVIHPDGRHLYACISGEPGGVAAYAIDPQTGALTFLNRELAGGGDTSFISLDRTGRYALAANYDGGSAAVFAIRPDGALGDWTAFVQQAGRGADPVRQTHAYAHSIVPDPTNRFALVADLGVDKVFVYRFDARDGTLKPNDPAFAAVAPGSGARHVRFHPNGRWVYVINEMASTISGFNWASASGALAEFQTVSTLPAGFSGKNATAEVEVHPNGRFLYASNRGDDSLAFFAIDQDTGRLGLVGHVPSGGRMPRNFALDPTGNWIICTNHDSDNAVVFRIDASTGRLVQAGRPVSVPSPYCERFLPVPGR
ncbi:MAG TPA: lactonase family protein [Opitutaceae bacterium]|nr:lactonase family protein [Opitutaceae bacterium]